MKENKWHLIGVAMLIVAAIAFGVLGTVAPSLPEDSGPVQPQQSSSYGSHFQNPPTYDSDWVDIKNKKGQYFSLIHNLNTTDVLVDITGRQSLDDLGGEHQRNLGGTDITPGANYTYGEMGTAFAYSVIKATDGTYMIAGVLNGDFYLIKASPSGDKLWSQTYGGSGYEEARSVVETVDGFALAGYTNSFGAGSWDAWLVRTDSSGNHLLNKTYGGIGEDRVYGMIPAWGGFVLAGYTNSFGVGGTDGWLIATYGDGTVWWSQTYGGKDGNDILYSVAIEQMTASGFVLAGYTNSYGAGYNDAWLVKTDVLGNVQWNLTFGGSYNDEAAWVFETSDGALVLTGHTDSFGAGSSDFWLIKVNWLGSTVWNKTYGGPNTDRAHSVIQTSDGYAIAGETFSYGAGNNDFWLVKTDSNGDAQWSRSYGGTGMESAYSLIQIENGAYVMVGFPSPHSYIIDVWLVRTETDFDIGLAWTGMTDKRITLFRGRTDPYWNYVRVRMWLIEEPTWMYGDINQDGIVDARDLYIIGRNYGQTFSLLSLGGIVAIAGIRTVKKRKQSKQTSHVS